jgi:hypothetical protein
MLYYCTNCKKYIDKICKTQVRETEGANTFFCLPACWLAVGMYLEGPATGRLDTGFL